MMQLQSTSHWQPPQYDQRQIERLVRAIVIIWIELLAYTDLFEYLARLMRDNRQTIKRCIQMIIANFDIVVILICWIAGLVRWLNDCAVCYQAWDKWLLWYVGNWQMTPVRGLG